MSQSLPRCQPIARCPHLLVFFSGPFPCCNDSHGISSPLCAATHNLISTASPSPHHSCQLIPKTEPSKPSDYSLGEGTHHPLQEHVDTPKIVEICPEDHHQRIIIFVTLAVGGCMDCATMWWSDTIYKLLENISHSTEANKINQFLKQLWECMKILSKCQ